MLLSHTSLYMRGFFILGVLVHVLNEKHPYTYITHTIGNGYGSRSPWYIDSKMRHFPRKCTRWTVTARAHRALRSTYTLMAQNASTYSCRGVGGDGL